MHEKALNEEKPVKEIPNLPFKDNKKVKDDNNKNSFANAKRIKDQNAYFDDLHG